MTARVLVVDDDATVRDVVGRYLDEAGYQAHMDSEHFTRLVKEEAIPELLEARERAFYETIDDAAGGLDGS